MILIPPHEYKWTFKEGDVAVLSSPKPGAGKDLLKKPFVFFLPPFYDLDKTLV